MIWTKKDHSIWGKGGSEEHIHSLRPEFVGDFPKEQWVSGEFSIIPPCGISFGQYELYPVDDDIRRFDTLKEAQDFAEELTNPNV